MNLWQSTTQEGKKSKITKQVSIISDRVLYTQVSATIDIEMRDPASVKQPIYEEWKTFESEQLKLAPLSMKNMQQFSTAWIWMASEQAFVTSAI